MYHESWEDETFEDALRQDYSISISGANNSAGTNYYLSFNYLDDKGYIMATLPANTDKKVPVIGFIAHMDTSPDLTGKDVNPQIIKNYDGKDIVLNKEQNVTLSPSDFPPGSPAFPHVPVP